MVGAGRLAANDAIVDVVMQVLASAAPVEQDLAGETILVTAGPTREKIDPVRYISNRSSGKMGYAIAEAAARRGARVLLVTGPATAKLPQHPRIEVTRVETTAEMRDAVLALLPQATSVIKAAAVGDYRVKQIAEQKIKRGGPMVLELEPNPDILKEIAARKQNQVVIGFAAETQDVLANGRKKLESKSLDAIVINDVSREGVGFDADRNAVTILTHEGETVVPEAAKGEVAGRILDQLPRLRARRAVLA
jgi:phosphopantothenoylcysteine decarboxylase/phosphopantothenate--cysteine ligase